MAARGYKIGDVANSSGLTVKTIRYYEQIGLIPRAPRRNSGARTGGNRVYGESDLGRLRFIGHARLLGLGLAEIHQLLDLADGTGCPSTQPEYREILKRRLAETDDRINHLLGLRAALEGLLSPDRQTMEQPCSMRTCACMEPVPRRGGSRSVIGSREWHGNGKP